MPASPTVDAHNSNTFGPAAASGSCSITTTKTNDLICCFTTFIQTAAIFVSSVTAPGLTFSKIIGSTVIDPARLSPHQIGLELWAAPAAAVLSSVSVTVNMSATADVGCIGIVAVNGAAGWDPNSASQQTTSFPNTITPSFNWSTTLPDDLILAAGGSSASGMLGATFTGTGQTWVTDLNFQHSSAFSQMLVQHLPVSAAQAGVATRLQCSVGGIMLIAAVTADAPVAAPGQNAVTINAG